MTPEERAMAVVAQTYGVTSRQALGEAIADAVRAAVAAAVAADRERIAAAADTTADAWESLAHRTRRLYGETPAAQEFAESARQFREFAAFIRG